MICGFSSQLPQARSDSQGTVPHNLPATTEDDTLRSFHPYARLPFELRHLIWSEYLSQDGPRAYTLVLECVDFVPVKRYHYMNEPWDLVTGTAASRILGSTCRDAREAVTSLLPDTLKLKVGSFRFNAQQDIIILISSSPRDQRYTLEWASTGKVPDTFRTIQHLALGVGCVESELLGKNWSQCHCGEPGCSICKDPLPEFLSLFPSLKSFHIAQTDPIWKPYEGRDSVSVLPVEPCKCVGATGHARHIWPLFKNMSSDEWFISYEEYSNCPFPTLPALERDRRISGGSNWPYYDALGHLDMRILRKVVLDGDTASRMEKIRVDFGFEPFLAYDRPVGIH